MSKFLQDLRFAFRTLAKVPAFTAIAVLTLGLGIGANTTIFTAVDTFMLTPLPYDESDQLVIMRTTVPERGWTQSVSAPDFLDARSQARTVDLAVYDSWGFNLAGDEQPERADGMKVTNAFFDILRVDPVRGVGFAPEDDFAESPTSAIISHRLWQRRFGGDPDILSRTLILDGRTHEIVGVMPEGFWFQRQSVDIWVPIDRNQFDDRSWRGLGVMGRLRDGVTIDQSQEDMNSVASALEATYPETNEGRHFQLTGLHADIFDEGFETGTSVSSLAVAFVLLIACANVANLILARAAGRTRELALRTALGASRLRIVSQLLTESLLLAVAGGAFGLFVAWGGVKGLVAVIPPTFPRADEIALSGRAVLFTLIASAATAVIFGLLPALQSSRPNLTESLKEGGRSNTGGGGKLRQTLVVVELALAMVLVVSSSLLVKGFRTLRSSDYGFETENVLTMRFDLPDNVYVEDEQVYAFYSTLFESVRSVPGVNAAGAVHRLPRTGNSSVYFSMPGDDVAGNDRPIVSARWIDGEYFQALGVPILQGRTFSATETPTSASAIIINKKMAEDHWPDGGALGQTVLFTDGPSEVIGVVENFADVDQDIRSMVFFSGQQTPQRFMSMLVRTGREPMQTAPQVLDRIAAIDPNLPMWSVGSLGEFMDLQDAGNGVMVKIMLVLAGLALSLSIVGVYGVMAYAVSQRTQEIGVRMALGAKSGHVVKMFLAKGATLALIGVLVGTGLAAATTRMLSFFLFGVSPFDPAVFGFVIVTLLASGLIASFIPARRATRVDPIETLRTE